MSVGTDLLMRSVAKMLDEKLNGIDSVSPLGDLSTRQTGFVLLVFPFGAEEGRGGRGFVRGGREVLGGERMSEHTPLPWATDPDDREGYEWNIHIVQESDRVLED